MSLIIVAIMLSPALQGSSATDTQAPAARSTATSAGTSQSAGVSSAREWVAQVDSRRWRDSWRTAGTLFKSQVTAAEWASTIQPVREPLGAVSSRTLQSATRSSSLPGAPAGEYEIVQFQTSFAEKSGAIETIVLAREDSGWKVVGYFIR